MDEDKIIMDLNYCIKVISSNQLYEANLDYPENNPDANSKDHNEVQMLMN